MQNRIIDCFRSEQTVLQVKAGTDVRKIAQITFSKKGGSLFVSLPYFAITQGLLSVATLEAGRVSGELSLVPKGKCTSHLVKYAHHSDGEAHFSQDGKILTSIRRKALPLRSIQGHIFTILTQGSKKFEAAQSPKDFSAPTKKRANLTFDVGEKPPEALKFVGRIYDVRFFGNMLAVGSPDRGGPVIGIPVENGLIVPAFCIGNPHDFSDQALLLVSCQHIQKVDKIRDDIMTFIGGFDSRERATSVEMETSYLVLNYPTDGDNRLRDLIGSVDYIPPQ